MTVAVLSADTEATLPSVMEAKLNDRPAGSPPRLVRGRRGGKSIVDALVKALWWDAMDDRQWPVRTIPALRDEVSRQLNYDAPPSSVRSTLYSRTDVFERTQVLGQGVAYRLTEWARGQGT